jgi:hypothetical protein
MKTDTYTKIVLTVIAGLLLCLCVQNAVHPQMVSAQGGLQKVTIAGIELGYGPSLPVWINGGSSSVVAATQFNPLPVRIVQTETNPAKKK